MEDEAINGSPDAFRGEVPSLGTSSLRGVHVGQHSSGQIKKHAFPAPNFLASGRGREIYLYGRRTPNSLGRSLTVRSIIFIVRLMSSTASSRDREFGEFFSRRNHSNFRWSHTYFSAENRYSHPFP